MRRNVGGTGLKKIALLWFLAAFFLAAPEATAKGTVSLDLLTSDSLSGTVEYAADPNVAVVASYGRLSTTNKGVSVSGSMFGGGMRYYPAGKTPDGFWLGGRLLTLSAAARSGSITGRASADGFAAEVGMKAIAETGWFVEFRLTGSQLWGSMDVDGARGPLITGGAGLGIALGIAI